MKTWRWVAGFVLCAGAVSAQVIPPMQDPFPTGPPAGQTRGSSRQERNVDGLLLGFGGRIRSVDAKAMVLATEDGRELRIFLTKSTKFVREGETLKTVALKPGMVVSVEARQNAEFFLFAVAVQIMKDASDAAPEPAPKATSKAASKAAPKAAPAAEEAIGPTTTMAPAPSMDPDDAGPPKVKRGKPERVVRAEREAAVAPAPAAAAVPVAAAAAAPSVTIDEPMEDPQIAKAREAAQEFTASLPNYLVRQHTTRYWSDTAKVEWRPLDVLSLTVVYENGKESYRNVRVNNKLTSKPLDALSGSVSQGEFGSTLADLLSSSTNAEFRRRGTTQVGGHSAWRFDFKVELANSHWTVRTGSQSIRPAYKGTVWVERDTARVLRIEMQAQNLPGDYPLDVTEWMVEYGSVKFDTHEFLVPVKAEVLACWRGSAKCSRNETEFRNYHRFTGESDLYLVDTKVDFGSDPAPAAPAVPPAAPPTKP
jgi:hypothetical protein